MSKRILLALFLLFFVFSNYNISSANDDNQEDEVKLNFECKVPCGLPTEMIRIPQGGRFGDPRSYREGIHIGLDISNLCGEPIWTQADGTVKEVSYDESRGNYVVINHGSYETWYAHLEEVFVRKDLPIEKKEIIGTIGITGMSEGCHLHYEVWLDEEPMDPELFINAVVKEGDPVVPDEFSKEPSGYCMLEPFKCIEKDIREISEDRSDNHFEEQIAKRYPELEGNTQDIKEKINLLDEMVAKLGTDDSYLDLSNYLEELILDLGKNVQAQQTEKEIVMNFTRNLSIGSRGDDVKSLQQLLNKKGYLISSSGPGSPGNETDYFGKLTKAAVIRFQEANASQILHPLGLTSGTGYVGPSTRSLLNNMISV